MEQTQMTKGRSDAGPGQQTLLVVGPQPPPLGGGAATVQVLLDELAMRQTIGVLAINTSPPPEYSKKAMLGLSLEKARRGFSITKQYLRAIEYSSAALVFSNNLFTLTAVPLLLLLAHGRHKPFYLKPVGGDLDLFLAAKNPLLRRYLVGILRRADGILAQTRQLQERLRQLGCRNVYYLPGYRSPCRCARPSVGKEPGVRLIFLAQITREKGAMTLLEALRLLPPELGACGDFYGPIFAEDRDEFLWRLRDTPGARYCGVVEFAQSVSLIAGYDALVLPTYFDGEGHPGVIIEAMQAGVPVISTWHRAIPELITDGDNGFLVPVLDSRALADRIGRLATDRVLREKMGAANYDRGREFRSDTVIPRLLEVLFSERRTR